MGDRAGIRSTALGPSALRSTCFWPRGSPHRRGTAPVTMATPLPYSPHINYRRGRGRPIDVLLLDAQYRQGLTCIRGFAQAGLAVGAATSVSESRWAPGFRVAVVRGDDDVA